MLKLIKLPYNLGIRDSLASRDWGGGSPVEGLKNEALSAYEEDYAQVDATHGEPS